MSILKASASVQIISTPIKSDMINAVEYIPSTKQLGVEFSSGGRYVYEGVTSSEYSELVNAASVGHYFSEHIRGAKSFTKL